MLDLLFSDFFKRFSAAILQKYYLTSFPLRILEPRNKESVSQTTVSFWDELRSMGIIIILLMYDIVGLEEYVYQPHAKWKIHTSENFV